MGGYYMKLGFISEFSVDDKLAWSGTINFLWTTLSCKHELYPIVVKPNIFHRGIRKLIRILSFGQLDYTLLDRMFYYYAINRKVKIALSNGVDVFFAPAASSILGCAKIPSCYRVIYLSDATYHCMLNYYFDGGTAGNIRRHENAEKSSLERADAVIYASDWAKRDAISYYGVASQKITVLPFGANLEDRYQPHDLNKKTVKILFVGVDWERKGADLAIEIVRQLNALSNGNRKFELTMIGIDAPSDYFQKDVTFVGRLHKDNISEREKLISYYQHSDIFLLPTKAECAGIVFSEAAMFGLPVFTHNTGGTMSYVEDGKTGRGLKLGSTARDFANAILEMINSGHYKEWSQNARKKYELELNWNVWLQKFEDILNG